MSTIRFACALLAGVLLAPAALALAPGEPAPVFSAPASLDGNAIAFDLAAALERGPVVVYFYPAAYTRGCDLQAHAFAEQHERFTAAGASIIGVSADALEKLNEFSADPEFCAGKFAVASDPDGAIGARYGLELSPVPDGATDVRGAPLTHGVLPRVTFVLDRDGTVVARLSSADDNLGPEQHVSRSLALVEELAAGQGAE